MSFTFNRNILKLIAALAIPAGIIWFFLYSQGEANREVADYKKQQQLHPSASSVTIVNYALKEVDDANNIRWQLTASQGLAAPDSQDVKLQDVKVDYFDPGTKTLKLRLIAPFGAANQQTKKVQLSGGPGNIVTAEGSGSKLQCKQVELIKKNQFLATGDVIIDWPGVAKVNANSASGSIEMTGGPKDLKLSGNTHALIMMR